jgi:cell cycle arrest protein BUB2
MLVRLLDAFVWRSTEATESTSPTSPTFPYTPATYGRSRQAQQPNQPLGFNYVQGMNVLAAPFLYIMPTEVEAFYTFARFIERACPLYVQPTLEGVHRGLKVVLLASNTPIYVLLNITN